MSAVGGHVVGAIVLCKWNVIIEASSMLLTYNFIPAIYDFHVIFFKGRTLTKFQYLWVDNVVFLEF